MSWPKEKIILEDDIDPGYSSSSVFLLLLGVKYFLLSEIFLGGFPQEAGYFPFDTGLPFKPIPSLVNIDGKRYESQ